ncbi:hypothetical protein RRG08_035503 [Elysia crispata]|uniref:Uncharacterized protein n=1 Tax=Elysia crispata TaxID=231223 RepID=A0AAE1E2M1_9GAST|nr:hypothetical protein RRG08_035503 [Elysia crispata]
MISIWNDTSPLVSNVIANDFITGLNPTIPPMVHSFDPEGEKRHKQFTSAGGTLLYPRRRRWRVFGLEREGKRKRSRLEQACKNVTIYNLDSVRGFGVLLCKQSDVPGGSYSLKTNKPPFYRNR